MPGAAAGDKVFIPLHFHGEEQLSAPFEYTVDLLTEKGDVEFDKIVGEAVTVKMALAEEGAFRYVNGVVSEWMALGETGYEIEEDVPLYLYRARLVPWLWPLMLTQDHRIFQEKNAKDIIQQVFKDLGYSDFKFETKATYPKREYCVQYGESAFAFVSRLMEEEGIFYFFTHEDGKHTLTLADDISAFGDLGSFEMGNDFDEYIADRVRTLQAQYALISTNYELDDFDFEKPMTSLTTKEKALSPGQAIAKLEVYEYPGRYTEKQVGTQQAKLRIEERERDRELFQGTSTCMAFSAGHLFTLTDHRQEAYNQVYQLRSVRTQVRNPWHFTGESGEYMNEFIAAPKLGASKKPVQFRPPRVTPRPRIYGLQSAVVVGKKGEEIWTDKHGRIKVQFHWDREGKNDENSSCWIRVAQSWAGKQWGGFILPRVGMEVLVSFLDGDPDRPLVTGAVYNGDNKAPYSLPDNQTKSTLKSRTSKGGEGFNEIRFEDKEEKEEVFIHGHRDMNVETIKGNLHIIVGKENPDPGDMVVEVMKGKSAKTVHEGDMTVDVLKGNFTHTVSEGNMKVDVLKGQFDQSVKKDYTLKVEGNLTIEVTGDISIKGKSISLESTSSDVSITAAGNLTGEATGNLEMKGVSAKVEGSASAELKGSASAKVDGGGMTEVKGGMVKIN